MNNNNVCLLADTHFGFDNNSEIFLKNSIDFFTKQLIPFLKTENINEIFILGDIFDSRVNININVNNIVYDLFDVILKDFKIYILIGNHDVYYNSTNDIHSLKFLRKFENVTLIEKPTVIELYNKKILICPWVNDYLELTKIINNNKSDIIMGHFDIVGFNFNKVILSKNGMPHDLFIDKCDIVFSGHFHTRSIKRINNTEIIYIGSPYQLTRADMDEDRGFLIYNFDLNKYNFFTNDISTKFFKLEYPETYTQKDIENNFIDVHISYNYDNYNQNDYLSYMEDIEKFNPIKITPFYNDEKLELQHNGEQINANRLSIIELINIYVESLKINDCDKNTVLNILIDLFNNINKR